MRWHFDERLIKCQQTNMLNELDSTNEHGLKLMKRKMCAVSIILYYFGKVYLEQKTSRISKWRKQNKRGRYQTYLCQDQLSYSTFVNVCLEENTSLVYPSILDRNNKWEGYRTYLCSNSGAYASHPPFVVGKFLS